MAAEQQQNQTVTPEQPQSPPSRDLPARRPQVRLKRHVPPTIYSFLRACGVQAGDVAAAVRMVFQLAQGVWVRKPTNTKQGIEYIDVFDPVATVQAARLAADIMGIAKHSSVASAHRPRIEPRPRPPAKPAKPTASHP